MILFLVMGINFILFKKWNFIMLVSVSFVD